MKTMRKSINFDGNTSVICIYDTRENVAVVSVDDVILKACNVSDSCETQGKRHYKPIIKVIENISFSLYIFY